MAKRIYNQQALFGELYAYLVVISPPEEVRAKIARIKDEMNQLAAIGQRNLHAIGHITLTDKLTDDEDFAGTIAQLIGKRQKFRVRISGFGIFNHGPDKKTVYLNIENPKPISDLMAAVKVHSGFPHLALLKNISAQTLEKLQPYLDTFTFCAEWQCLEVIVLKKLMREKYLGWKDSIAIPLE